MSKKKKQKSKPTSGFISRTRSIVTAISIVILGGGFTVYALSTYHTKLVTHTDIPTVQTSDSDKTSGTSTTTTPPTTPTKTTPSTTPPTSSTPSNVVTPGSSTDVPTLTPPKTGSNSTTSYQSTNWSGYLSTGGSFTAVSGTWIAPSPTATSTTVESGDGTWIGIGGLSTSDLIQVGTQNTISPSGIVSTTGFYELLPASAVGIGSLTITPGDTISASITQTATSQWTISLTDVTTGQTFSTSVSYVSSLSSAEWIQEDPSNPDGSLVLLDNFGTVQFSNATTIMNGTTMSAAASNASQITLVGQGGAAGHGGTPSSLSGSSFTVQYQ
ncbi:MAG: hypothetical protein JWN12_842 [Candidatus Saccharibacteria bacterium]|nr:hypothetical protein [Candidatus Saccharibacteria bacterium]